MVLKIWSARASPGLVPDGHAQSRPRRFGVSGREAEPASLHFEMHLSTPRPPHPPKLRCPCSRRTMPGAALGQLLRERWASPARPGPHPPILPAGRPGRSGLLPPVLAVMAGLGPLWDSSHRAAADLCCTPRPEAGCRANGDSRTLTHVVRAFLELKKGTMTKKNEQKDQEGGGGREGGGRGKEEEEKEEEEEERIVKYVENPRSVESPGASCQAET